MISEEGVAVEFGFEPSLDKISYGAFKDAENYMKDVKDLHRLMSVLYRPVIEKDGKNYSIEAYGISDSRMRAEKFKKMKASEVNSALVFFWTLGKKLLMTLPSFLMEQSKKILDKAQMNNLQTSGVGSE